MPVSSYMLQSSEFFNDQLEKAKEFVQGGVPMAFAPEFSGKINDRLKIVSQVADAQSRKINHKEFATVNRLMSQVFNEEKSKSTRIVWLQRAADHFSKAVGPHASCKSGCNHCCHIPVSVSHAEAQAIGKAIGQVPVTNPKSHIEEASYSNPCVFLKDGACSIYDARPIACRTHFNMDVDALLCELQPGNSIPVPYMDARPFSMASLFISGGGRLADIRGWFPKRTGSENGKV